MWRGNVTLIHALTSTLVFTCQIGENENLLPANSENLSKRRKSEIKDLPKVKEGNLVSLGETTAEKNDDDADAVNGVKKNGNDQGQVYADQSSQMNNVC